MKLFTKKNRKILAYTSGVAIPLEKVNDNMFSKGLMGKGIAIEPEENSIYSPVNGKITMIFPTLHAMGILGDDGYEYLLHIGIDTVELKGEGFEVFVNDDDKVKAGDLLMKVDFNVIDSHNYQKTAILCITNLSEGDVEILQLGEIHAKDKLLKINK